jgi:iron complex transport system permease protein
VFALLSVAVSLSWALPGGTEAHDILWQLRLPRVLLAAFCGGALALCGAVLQGFFRNPLVEPGLLGISAGAGLAAVLVLTLGVSTLWLLPLAAAVGAALALGLVLLLAQRVGGAAENLLLAGIAINALAGALVNLLLSLSDNTTLRSATFWLMGSFTLAQPPLLWCSLVLLPVLALLLWRRATALDIWALGEAEARHLGLDVTRFRREVVWLCAVLVALAVAQAGSIGFIGLLGPHLARRLVGSAHGRLLPGGLWMGAALAVWADLLARTLVAPLELPVGVLTALLGAPLFLALFLRRRAWP